jgi:hypothetical protein
MRIQFEEKTIMRDTIECLDDVEEDHREPLPLLERTMDGMLELIDVVKCGVGVPEAGLSSMKEVGLLKEGGEPFFDHPLEGAHDEGGDGDDAIRGRVRPRALFVEAEGVRLFPAFSQDPSPMKR